MSCVCTVYSYCWGDLVTRTGERDIRSVSGRIDIDPNVHRKWRPVWADLSLLLVQISFTVNSSQNIVVDQQLKYETQDFVTGDIIFKVVKFAFKSFPRHILLALH